MFPVPHPGRASILPAADPIPSSAAAAAATVGGASRFLLVRCGVACVRPPLALSLSLSASSFLALLASWLRLHWAETERNTELRSRIERRRGRTRPPPRRRGGMRRRRGKKPTASEHGSTGRTGGGRNASWRFSISAGCMSAPPKKEEGKRERGSGAMDSGWLSTGHHRCCPCLMFQGLAA